MPDLLGLADLLRLLLRLLDFVLSLLYRYVRGDLDLVRVVERLRLLVMLLLLPLPLFVPDIRLDRVLALDLVRFLDLLFVVLRRLLALLALLVRGVLLFDLMDTLLADIGVLLVCSKIF